MNKQEFDNRHWLSGGTCHKYSHRTWRCFCGKYKKKKYGGIICDYCGIEVQPIAQMVRAIWVADGERWSKNNQETRP